MWNVKVEGASSYSIAFDPLTKTEPMHDYVRFLEVTYFEAFVFNGLEVTLMLYFDGLKVASSRGLFLFATLSSYMYDSMVEAQNKHKNDKSWCC